MVKITFICIYQPIYTFCLVGALRSLCAATLILLRCRRPYCAAMATSRRCRRLTALLRGTRGDPTALSQDDVPTAFVLSMFKVRAGVLCDHCGCRNVACISTARRSRVLDIFMTLSWCDCNFRSSMK